MACTQKLRFFEDRLLNPLNRGLCGLLRRLGAWGGCLGQGFLTAQNKANKNI